jgi:hypothetical protein
MNEEWSRIAANAIAHEANMAADAWKTAAYSQERPCVLFKPAIFAYGDMWCALLGDDLQTGVSGFGETPDKAMAAFDQAFWKGETPAATRAARGEQP